MPRITHIHDYRLTFTMGDHDSSTSVYHCSTCGADLSLLIELQAGAELKRTITVKHQEEVTE
jgi:hypothetical protein